MANTGELVWDTLKEVYAPCPGNCGNVPGSTPKPNLTTDPDYLPPVIDFSKCSVTIALDCPVPIQTTGGSGVAEFEFTLSPACLAVPNLVTVRFVLTQGGSEMYGIDLPVSGYYYSGSITPVAAGTYNLRIVYRDGSGTTLPSGSCDIPTKTVTVS